MIVSLAFAPTGDLEEALTEVSRVLLRELLPALAWFEITYLSRPKSSGGRGRHRTNNFVEAAHRRMRIAFGCESSNVTGNHLPAGSSRQAVDWIRWIRKYGPRRHLMKCDGLRIHGIDLSGQRNRSGDRLAGRLLCAGQQRAQTTAARETAPMTVRTTIRLKHPGWLVDRIMLARTTAYPEEQRTSSWQSSPSPAQKYM
ncbi:hypothetical protein M513_14006 [Trichuris suis]|uniref:Uncharacterized protein n=1 Tax=Trichuris suis TaxID=68888 RepID=A0A085LJH1_9BILA|nr:hypothetical protein M513_14006 [Trichuris suis]